MALPMHRTEIRTLVTQHTILVVLVCACIVTVGLLSDVLILALAVSLVIAIVGVVTLRTRIMSAITQPLKDVTSVTHAIAEGAVSGRIEVPHSASVDAAQVADAINKLAARASTDIEELRRLERVRSEFIANVSHELRTPIFSVQGYLETLLDGAADDPAVSQQFLEKAYNNALRLNVLLNDLIDISRIESGELKFSFRSFDVTDLIRDLVQELQIRAEQQHVSITTAMPDDAYVYGDRERISQVLVNLVENAIKYNVANGRVDIIVERDADRWKITVRDTGIGIPEEHLPRIFERFYRVDKDRSRAVGGTGLGLAIVKHICEAHRSNVTMTSMPNVGTTISFSLAEG